MKREEIEKKVNQIILDILGGYESQLKADTRLKEDLGADSIDTSAMTMEFEDEFNISIPDEKMDSFLDCTLSEIYDLIEDMV